MFKVYSLKPTNVFQMKECETREIVPDEYIHCLDEEKKASILYTIDDVSYPTVIQPIEDLINACTTSIGCLGLIANFAAVIILLQIKSGYLFNRTLATLAIIGT